MERLIQNRLLQIIVGLLLSFGLLRLFIELSGPHMYFYYLIYDYGTITAAVVTLACLGLTFVSHAGRLPWFGRSANRIVMKAGEYGRIGASFQPGAKAKKTLERLPGGFWLGISTYRGEDGNLQFVVRPRASLQQLAGRTLAAVLLTVLLSQPVLALAGLGILDEPVTGESNLLTSGIVGAADWVSGLFPSADGETTDTEAEIISTEDTEDTTTDSETESNTTIDSTTVPDTTDTTGTEDTTAADDTTDTDTDTTDSSGGVLGWIGDKVSGIGEWFGGLFSSDGETDADVISTDGTYLLPSSERELTEEDIAGMDYDDIQLAINELYAKHGFDFRGSSNQQAAEYFPAQSWYEPDASITMEEAEAQFSEIERTNLHFLIARRNELR